MTHPLKLIDYRVNERGEVSGVLFENPRTSVRRNLYWSACIELSRFTYFGEDWKTILSFDWLVLPSEKTSFEISDQNIDVVECSWYFIYQHITAKSGTLTLEPVDEYRAFEISFSVVVDSPGWDDDPCQDIEIAGTVKLPCSGISLMRNSFFPKPNSEIEAREMIAPFFPEIVDFTLKQQEDEDGWPIQEKTKFHFVPQ
ncbi:MULTISPECIES: hypothetical protein [unclassified Pseudovibrio]|uniref:hypothetical protein n=1 Tax=unclassified Pseudovibrio TaxID=2627060 RepID=UPI0007AE410E|nr:MULTISPECIES: hypothetical protein [unclassified Pseudovibrio]KZK96877.1 hypothetical protein PsAD26_05673 [Pseudovibrio sp. Ad26]